MKVVIVVPRRDDGGHRDKLWAFCKAIWEERFPIWPVYEGHHNDGPFNRSAGINAGVALASADVPDWDVALLIDGDTISAPNAVITAVALAAQTGLMVVAHDERIMMSRRGTDRLMAGYQGSWRTDGMAEHVWADSVSCAVAVSRRLWEAAGPFDEGFRGWGREDTAFRISCEVETDSPILKVAGEVFHLWHQTAPEVSLRHPNRIANEKRHQAYVAARGDRAAVRALRGVGDAPAASVDELVSAGEAVRVIARSQEERLLAQLRAPDSAPWQIGMPGGLVSAVGGPAARGSSGFPPSNEAPVSGNPTVPDRHETGSRPPIIMRIPRILHRTVPAETTAEVEGWWARFGELHPEWDLRTYREPIDPAAFPETGHLFARCANGAQKAGLIRLELLVAHGGVYVDSDVEPFRSLESLRYVPAFAAWEDAHVVPDAVLGCIPQHTAFVVMLEKAKALVAGGSQDAWTTGPGVSTAVLPGRDDVLLLPPGAFYPMHYLDRASRSLVQDARAPWVFAMHHYHHSWGSDANKAAIDAKQTSPGA